MTPQYRFNSSDHLHELRVDGQWVPLTGTSSVLSVIAKPLTYWAAGLAVKEFGCPDPKVLTKIRNGKVTPEETIQLHKAAFAKLQHIQTMKLNDYVKLLDRAYRAHATNLKDTAEVGTDLHAYLSEFVRYHMGGSGPELWHPRITPFIKWTEANVDRFLWSETHCFSRTHFIGGISDCGFIDKQGRMGILDFKSAKQAFWGAFVQCAGYDIQITENGGYDADGNRTLHLPMDKSDFEDVKEFSYYAVLPFGMEQPQVQINEDVAGCRENFLHALALYRAMPRE